jgi:peptide/nickel transport system substrate-binding protein
MVRHRIMIALSMLMLAGIVLSACGPAKTPAVPTATPGETTRQPAGPTASTPGQTPVPERKTLVVCQAQEPSSLYLYATNELAAHHVWEAIYDGPIDTVNYSYQAVALEKLPSLADGDAVINPVKVGVGSKVVSDLGNPLELTGTITRPVLLRPAGCATSTCAVPWLPVSGTLLMDQMVVTFTMKQGLTWADGTPVKASDSVYSWNLNANPDTPAGSRDLFDRSASYKARDDRTIVWTGLPGYRDSAYMVNFSRLLPEHVLGKYAATAMPATEEAARTPLGYGPFTVKEWIAGDHITVVKNPYYFRAAEGLPHIDTIIYRFVGEDANPAIAAALSGECDILTQDIGLDAQAPLLQDLDARGVLIPAFAAGPLLEHLDWGLQPASDYARPDFFSDQRMREAMASCIDRQRVVDTLLAGESLAPASYVPPTHPLYNPDVKARAYDPDAARALLDEMGWEDVDGDGIRECTTCKTPGAKKGVTKLQFRWTSTDSPQHVASMQLWQANLRDCGLDIVLENIPASALFTTGPDSPLGGRRYDVASYAWLSSVEPPCSLYLTSQIPSEANGWAGQNHIGFSDPEFDQACNSALQSLPGTAEYSKYHREAQRIFAEKLPSLPLYLRLKVAACRPEVSGFALDPTASSEMWDAENLDLVLP